MFFNVEAFFSEEQKCFKFSILRLQCIFDILKLAV